MEAATPSGKLIERYAMQDGHCKEWIEWVTPARERKQFERQGGGMFWPSSLPSAPGPPRRIRHPMC